LLAATWIAMSAFWGFAFTRWIDPHWPHGHAAELSPGQDLREHLRDLADLLRGANPYQLRARLNDTTPPATALLMTPFSWVATPISELLSVITSLAALAASEAMLLVTVMRTSKGRALLVSAAVLSPLAAAGLLPVFNTLVTGQLHLWLLSLILLDLLLVAPRRSGYLVGAVTAIIFWPGLFIVVVLHRSKVPGLLRACVGAVGVTLLAAMVAPAASVHYFFSVLPSGQAVLREVMVVLPHHLGSLAIVGNQSIHGWLLRPPLASMTASPWLYGAVAIVTVGIGVLTAWRLLDQGEVVVALIVVALTCLLATPFAWLHHWVWVVLFPFGAVACWRRRRVLAVVLVLGLIPFIHGVGIMVTNQGVVLHEGVVTMVRINIATMVGIVVLLTALCSSIWAGPVTRARHTRASPLYGVHQLPF
jgi:alpha-1,2-mannosyltransferase